MARYRVAVDIGGTFTDVVAVNLDSGEFRTGKVLNVPGRPGEGVVDGILSVVPEATEVESIVQHGTTAGLNAFLERKGARVALVTTQGLRDVYLIGRGNRPEMYNIRYRRPEPLIKRRDIFELPERIGADGGVVRAPEEAEMADVVRQIERGGYEAIAVSFLNAYVNPAHEQDFCDFLAARIPQVSITPSHAVAREWREYERTSTAVLNAYIAPIVGTYVERLQGELARRGIRAPLYVMLSSGGLMLARSAQDRAVQTLFSGPVGGAVGAGVVARTTGWRDLIAVDMGGTSFDISLIEDGQVAVTTEVELEGFPILKPMVNIHSIGAGGGSIGWVEAGGMRVGPVSAGAYPGPACYRRGGEETTVTDANVYLGRIDPELFLGGRMDLDTEASARAVERYAERLGVPPRAAAEGVLRVINAKMADGIRQITVRQGIDPRGFTLLAFGGAGPMHVALIAEELAIRRVLVPTSPGAFSAWGMLHTDARVDAVRTVFRVIDGIDQHLLQEVGTSMEEDLMAALREQGFTRGTIVFERTADMRYVGQEYSLNVPLEAPDGLTPEVLGVAGQVFHQRHQRVYGHHNPASPIELVNLRMVAIGSIGDIPAVTSAGTTSQAAAVARHARVVFNGEALDTPVMIRDEIPAGVRIPGPRIIQELSATTVVPPGWSVGLDDWGNLQLVREGE